MEEFKIFKEYITKEECYQITKYFRRYLYLNEDNPNTYPSGLGLESGEQCSRYAELGIIQGEDGDSVYINNILIRIVDDIINKSQKMFNQDIDLFHLCYHTMLPGGFNGLHSDGNNLDGTPSGPNNTEEAQEYSALVYFNDYGIDYLGGELIFPNQDLCIKPEAGDLIIFKGDHNYSHSVNKLERGIRDTLVIFMSKKGNHGLVPYQSLPIPNSYDNE